MALFVLGFGDAIGDIVDPRRDDVGLLLDAERLPKPPEGSRARSEDGFRHPRRRVLPPAAVWRGRAG
jgi:hypothetical protein